ncbi:MAG TPA: GNAT family N-acetyltransferase [Gaiellaceae bacterium]|nr:GNAT family N-acetyltransferase [Gaiellaceae bacterium]
MTASVVRVEIREATAGDADRMATIYTLAARAAWADFIPGVGALEAEGDRFAAGLAEPGATTLVAEWGAEVAGFAVILVPSKEPIPGAGELDMLYTHPELWGKGAGRELLQAAVERLRALGCTSGVLWTAEANRRPRRIYEAAGWQPDGTRRTREWRGSTFEELRYRRDLPADRAASGA